MYHEFQRLYVIMKNLINFDLVTKCCATGGCGVIDNVLENWPQILDLCAYGAQNGTTIGYFGTNHNSFAELLHDPPPKFVS